MEELVENEQSVKNSNQIYKKQSSQKKTQINSKKSRMISSNQDLLYKNAALPEIASKLSKKNPQKHRYDNYKKIKPIESIKTFEKILSISIPELAKDLVDIERLKSKFMSELKPAKIYNLELFNSKIEKDILEKKIVYDVIPHSLKNITIASIDGSFVSKSFYGLDICLSRAIGVIYEFENSSKPVIEYYPESGIQNFSLEKVLHNTSEDEVTTQISINRALMEINLAIEMILSKRKKIDLIILDGSILSEQLNLIYSNNHEILEKYFNLIREYKKLYTICNQMDILLVGCIKDTRSSTFRKLFSRRMPHILKQFPQLKEISSFNYRKLMKYFSDLDFFHRILDCEERSCCFSINTPGNSFLPRQQELLNYEKANNEENYFNNFEFYASYLKPVKYDFPIRVEFCIDKKKSDIESIHKKITKICSIILPLSSKLEDFGMPIPQLEAHLRCKLNENDLNKIISILERGIFDELSKCSNQFLFESNYLKNYPTMDEFILKNGLLISKRRDRLPI